MFAENMMQICNFCAIENNIHENAPNKTDDISWDEHDKAIDEYYKPFKRPCLCMDPYEYYYYICLEHLPQLFLNFAKELIVTGNIKTVQTEQGWEATSSDVPRIVGKGSTPNAAALDLERQRLGDQGVMMNQKVVSTIKAIESFEANADRLMSKTISPYLHDGKLCTIAVWRESKPEVQGYGNTENEAKSDLLQQEQGGAVPNTPEPKAKPKGEPLPAGSQIRS